jgi:cytochrome c-type protein NapB
MERNRKTRLLAVLVGILFSVILFSCAPAKTYTEEDLGLRQETLYDESATIPVHGDTTKKEPGESIRLERSFENSPPLIPHDISGMLPLAEENICTGCHMPQEAMFSGATPIPSSHLIDLNTGEYLRGELDGGRFNCVQCHVIQTILTPAVENIFKGEFRDEKGRYRSNLLNILNEGVEVE